MTTRGDIPLAISPNDGGADVLKRAEIYLFVLFFLTFRDHLLMPCIQLVGISSCLPLC